MALEDILARCIEKWQAAGVRLAQPVDEAEVRSLWGDLGKRVSDDVILLYSMVGGFPGCEFDDERGFLWTLWPWDWIRQQNVEYGGEGVRFCDHSIQVLTWELRFEDERRSSVWEIGDSSMTAPSLEAFFGLYLEDPFRLMSPWSPRD